jgi:hypothetical protein
VDDEPLREFPVEEIPNEAAVFMRTHKSRMKGGIPEASAFYPHNGGMSVDWDKYATAEATLSRARKPQENAVVRMEVAAIRGIKDDLDVKHRPLPANRSHSEVNLPSEGVEQTEVRIKLRRIAEIVIALPLTQE